MRKNSMVAKPDRRIFNEKQFYADITTMKISRYQVEKLNFELRKNLSRLYRFYCFEQLERLTCKIIVRFVKKIIHRNTNICDKTRIRLMNLLQSKVKPLVV